MVLYCCYRCGYSVKNRTHFFKHLNRKNSCKPVQANISIIKVRQLYDCATDVVTPNESAVTPNESAVTPNESAVTPNDSKNLYKCKYCDKCVSKNSNLHRHYKRCKKLKEINELELIKEENEILKMKYEVIKKEKKKMRKEIEKILVSNCTINNYNTNSNNTIIINNFGNEKIDYLSKKYLSSLLKRPYTGIPQLLKDIHFNDDHPENKNIRIRNKKLKYGEVVNNNKWEIKNKKEIINDMVDNSYSILDEHYEEGGHELENIEKKIYDKFQDKYDNDDKQTKDTLSENAEMMVINNS